MFSGLLWQGGGVAGWKQTPTGNHRYVCLGHTGKQLVSVEAEATSISLCVRFVIWSQKPDENVILVALEFWNENVDVASKSTDAYETAAGSHVCVFPSPAPWYGLLHDALPTDPPSGEEVRSLTGVTRLIQSVKYMKYITSPPSYLCL